jgi:SAM-dependent methyltransferase
VFANREASTMIDPQLMNDVIEWDVYNWSHAVEHWETTVGKLEGGRVLCLGERNGGLSLWFALRGFQVICSDRNGPSDAARALHARHGVSQRIEYAEIDIFDLPYPENSFDLVACKSVIGGLKLVYKDASTRTLENQKLAVDQVRRVLKPGGYFLGAENMRGSLLHRWARYVRKGKKIGWRHLATDEIAWLFRDFAACDLRYFGLLGSYHRLDPINRLTSRLDTALSAVLPASWLYICFIAARK